MAAPIDELTNMLSKVIDENTFTAGAPDRMKAALQKAASLEAEVKSLEKQLVTMREARDELSAKCQNAHSANQAWAAREAELIKREQKIGELEKNVAVAQATANVYDRCFGMVFKNPEIKRSVFEGSSQQVPVNNNGYQSVQSLNHSRSITETQTTE